MALDRLGLPADDALTRGLKVRSDAPAGSGLGASSALIVALVGLLCERANVLLPPDEIADIAFHIERDIGVQSGKQDQYSAAFGGFNFIEFDAKVAVTRLDLPARVVSDLEARLLLCYTGIRRESSPIIADQRDRVRSRNARVLAGLRAQREIAHTMRAVLLAGDLDTFGALLDQSWTQKKAMSPLIATAAVERAYRLAIAQGALGGKVTGAGGGGHMFFYCPPGTRPAVARALRREGLSITGFRFEDGGMRTWRG